MALFNALCSGFETPPKMCLASLDNNTPDFLPGEEGIRGGVIVGIVVALIFVNILIVYCYRRSAKREMQGEMQMQIESAVSQYFALSQKDTGRPYVK